MRPFWGHVLPPLIHKKLGLNLGIPFINNEQQFIPPIKGKNLFGYFQNKNQIKKYQTTFNEFCISVSKLLPNVDSHDYVVHYRSGDSLIAKSHVLYYEHVKSLLKDKPITIVTDSINSAKEFFGLNDNIKYLSNNDPFIDFVILAKAKVIFCGPSTFSWWAMHIGPNAKEIYVPKFLEQNLGILRDNVKVKILAD